MEEILSLHFSIADIADEDAPHRRSQSSSCTGRGNRAPTAAPQYRSPAHQTTTLRLNQGKPYALRAGSALALAMPEGLYGFVAPAEPLREQDRQGIAPTENRGGRASDGGTQAEPGHQKTPHHPTPTSGFPDQHEPNPPLRRHPALGAETAPLPPTPPYRSPGNKGNHTGLPLRIQINIGHPALGRAGFEPPIWDFPVDTS